MQPPTPTIAHLARKENKVFFFKKKNKTTTTKTAPNRRRKKTHRAKFDPTPGKRDDQKIKTNLKKRHGNPFDVQRESVGERNQII